MALGVIFAATTEEASLLDADASLLEYYPAVKAKDIGGAHLAALQRVLQNDKTAALPGAARGLATLPEDFTRQLAGIHEDDLHGISRAWSDSPEWAASGWPPADVRELLTRLVALAHRARDERKLLHLRAADQSP